MYKYLRVTAIVLLAIITLSGTANALSVNWFEVNLTVNGSTKSYRTTATTVGKFLLEQNVVLGPVDTVTPGYDSALDSDKTTEIVITEGFNAVVNIDGRPEILPVAANTRVGDVIKKLAAERDIVCTFAGSKNEVVVPGKELKLSSLYTEKSVSTLPLMYDTEIVLDDQLEIGTEKVARAGVPGELQIVSSLTYMSGKVVKNQVMSESVVKAPVTEVVHQGTKTPPPRVTTEAGPQVYTLVMDMVATAYSAHYECTGKNPGDRGYGITASGRPVEHGIVAVDPKVIPLGTKLYVEGYGVSIAADTGSAIVGNKIDLYHERLEDARRYGRRNVKVYVLG